MDKEKVLEKEIDLIQNCITRMSQNSFSIKGWTIALTLAAIALLPEKVNKIFLCLIILIITAVFWYLDGFFLKTETLYRWKYNWVIKNRLKSEDYFCDLNPHNEKMRLPDKNESSAKEPSILSMMFSKTLCPFYCPIIILALSVMLVMLNRG